MDQKKSKVVKSKSSNSALPNDQVNGRNKKTCSNVEVQPNVVKKRGVYVEKKPYKMERLSPGPSKKSESSNRSSPTISPPPRRDRKKFLSSVLTILSQNTTSTQYPEKRRATSKDVVTKRSGHATRRRRSSPIPVAQNQRHEPRKPKYRSKTLNNNPNEIDKFIVWKKDTKQCTDRSPSSESENSKLPIRCDDEPSKNVESKQVAKNVEGKLVAEVKPSSKMQQRMELEPATLVSQDKEKDDKSGIYDFFVDLLETTLNVYNVKTEVNPNIDAATKSMESSVKLEIDESVATKLNDILKMQSEEFNEDIISKDFKNKKAFRKHNDNAHHWTKQSTKALGYEDSISEIKKDKTFGRSSTVRSESIFEGSKRDKKTRDKGRISPARSESTTIEVDLADEFIPKRASRSSNKTQQSCMRKRFISPNDSLMFASLASRSPPSRSPPGRMSQSFSYERKTNSPSKTQSVSTNISSKKRYKKQTLLGMLKEELSLDTYVAEEPQNLFEALKVMAKNKRRSTKIQFAENVKVDDDYIKREDFTTSECMKRKKLISPVKKKSKRDKTSNDYAETYRASGFISRPSKSDNEYFGDTESYHSLVVFDPDHEEYETHDYDTQLTRSPSPKSPAKRQIIDNRPLNSRISINYVNEDDDQEGTIRKFAESVVSAIDNRKANNENTKSVSRFILD